MNMFDEARSISCMIEMCDLSQSEMARRLGTSQSYIANKLRLLKLDGDLQEKICRNGLTERHARALLRLEEKDRRVALDKVCRDNLNVAECEALVDFLRDESAPKFIGRATGQARIDTFLSTLKSSIETLRSLGVDATSTTSLYGTKTYITIIIDEGK